MFYKSLKKSVYIGIVTVSLIMGGCASQTPVKTPSSSIIHSINNSSEIIQILHIQSKNYVSNGCHYYNADTGKLIQYIKNPSKKVQIAALTVKSTSYLNLKYIKNPDKDIIQVAVNHALKKPHQQEAHNLITLYHMIQNPSKEVTLQIFKAISSSRGFTNKFYCDKHNLPKKISKELANVLMKRYPGMLLCIKEPNKELQLAAVKKRGYLLEFIQNPDREVQLAAVKSAGRSIKYIKNPDKELQLAAVKSNGFAIEYIKNPDRDVQLAAVKSVGSAISYIKNPDKELQRAAVESTGFAINYIKNPSEELQLIAVRNKKNVCKKKMTDHPLLFIKSPSKSVQLAAVISCPYAIQFIDSPSKQIKILAYGHLSIPKPDYQVSDKNIKVYTKNGVVKIENKTNKFINILSIAEYSAIKIYNLTSISLPPQSVKIVNFPKDHLELTREIYLNNKYLKLGYAIEYKVGNSPAKSLFKLKKYSINNMLSN